MKKLLLIVLCTLLTNAKMVAQLDVPQSEKQALSTFYFSMNGSKWIQSSNWNNYNTQTWNWYGVAVVFGSYGGHVGWLSLSNNNLSGVLPNVFSTLMYIEDLDLSGNNIKGLSSDFKNLFLLSSLNITGNQNTLGKYIDFSANSALKTINIYSNDTEVVNIKNNKNFNFAASSKTSSLKSLFGLKCVAVDEPLKAKNKITPYDKLTVGWAPGYENNFQSDCSFYLSANDVKTSDLKIASPVQDFLNIQTTQKVDKVELYAVTGQLVKTIKSKEGNVTDLARGIYIVKVYTDKGLTTQKIIKE